MFLKLRKDTLKNKANFVLRSMILSIATIPAYAWSDAFLNQIAHPPHTIKPNVPFNAPSGYSPAQIQKAYGMSLITNQGEGQIIAIVDAYDSPTIEADLGVFSTTFNLPSCTTANGCFKKVYASGTQPPVDADWGTEIALDVQWAHALAPKAKIILVEAADASNGSLLLGIQTAVQQGANVVSMSWGSPESPSQSQYDSYFNIPNVTFMGSTGDSGNGVNWPAVSPYVIAAGGTSLTLDASGNYISETAWSGSSGGVSQYVQIPAYQVNFANKNNPNKMRGIPDVSSIGDANNGGLSVYDSAAGGWLIMGGTSAAAPAWAGMIAVAKSASTTPLTGLNTLLYHAATTAYSANYHDIVQGSNGSCGPVCTAGPGYDYVTGLGSPQAQNLIKAITGGGSPGTCTRSAPSVNLNPNTTQIIQQNGSVTISIDVVNNDSATCTPSTFNLTTATSSPLIKSALTSSSLNVPAGGGKMTTYMITKASNVANVGSIYTTNITVADTAINRPISTSSYVYIGNALQRKKN